MLNDNYKSYQKVNVSDVITLYELLLRWKKYSFVKILLGIFSRKLKVFQFKKMHKTKVKKDLLKFYAEDITVRFTTSVSHFLNTAGYILFDINDVQRFEKIIDENNFTDIEGMGNREYEICSHENIENVAAITIFLICRFNFPDFNKKLPNIQYYHFHLCKENNTSESPSGKAYTWTVPIDTLSEFHKAVIVESLEYTEEYDKYEIKKLCKKLLEKNHFLKNSMKNKVEIVKNILLVYPKITNKWLGEVLPFDENVTVGEDAKETRGKLLLKAVKDADPIFFETFKTLSPNRNKKNKKNKELQK